MKIEFTVPGKPVPQARPRFWKGRVFSPQGNKKTVALLAKVAMKGTALAEGRISCTITFFGANGHCDLDNLIKTIWDGCQGIVFKNDNQVKELHAYSFPRVHKDTPGTTCVTFEWVTPPAPTS